MSHMDPVIDLILRGSLALLFLAAASHKLHDPVRFRGIVLDYRLVPPVFVSTVAWLLIAFEIATAALLLTPRREIACPVQLGNDDDLFWPHPVEKPIVEHEQFAQIRLIQFGNDATAFGEQAERARGVECSNEHPERGVA